MSLKYNQKSVKQKDAIVASRKKFGKEFPNPSLTVQADKDRCDVNNIMSRYRKTGLIDHVRQHEGRYEDVASVGDFQEAMNIVAHAQQSFDLLPSEIRKRFNNDTSEFLEFVHNADNEQELVKMGLATAKLPVESEAKPASEPSSDPKGEE